MQRREASCSCGQLTVSAEGDPIRVSVCHCLACQRRTGSAFGVQARFQRERVTTSGEWQEYVRLADDDGEPRRFRFCGQCGATMFWVFDNSPELIVIPVGAFADPDFPAPRRVVYEPRRHPWLQIRGAEIEHPDWRPPETAD